MSTNGWALAVSGADIDDVVTGYLDAQLWLGLDWDHMVGDNPQPLDRNYDLDDFTDEYVAAVRAELVDVIAAHPLAVRMYLAQRTTAARDGSVSAHFGQDFYLNREGHGVGFWDRGLGELGDYLSDIAKSYGSAADLHDVDGKLAAA